MKKIFLILIALSFMMEINAQMPLLNIQLDEKGIDKSALLSSEQTKKAIWTKYFAQADFDINSDFKFEIERGYSINVKHTAAYEYSNGAFSSAGKIAGTEFGECTFSNYKGAISGMVDMVGDYRYLIQETKEGVFALSKISTDQFSAAEKANDAIELAKSAENKMMSNPDVCTTTPCPGNSTIDLMILFTPAVVATAGSNAAAVSNMTTAVTNMNTALVNSGITNLQFNLVYSDVITYTESANSNTDLTRLSGTTDGFMDNVHTLRTQYGADLVSLVLNNLEPNICGLGYLNSTSTNYSANAAFNVVAYSCAVSNYSLAHELGHNMGLNHDWYVDTNPNPCVHHHGYVNRTAINQGAGSAVSARWRTIMAYNTECSNIGINCSRINMWANPNVTYSAEPTGIPIGSPKPSDEAYGFARFGCVVAGFYSSCSSNITITSTYTTPLTQSSTWIVSSGTTTIPSGATVKLDVNPAVNGYIQLNPDFEAQAGSVFIAQAVDGCGALQPMRTAPNPNSSNPSGFTATTSQALPSDIKVFPNPMTDYLTIQHPSTIKNITLLDVYGRVLQTKAVSEATQTELNTAELPQGIYFVWIDGSIAAKVVK